MAIYPFSPSCALTVSAIVVAPPFGQHLVDSVQSVLGQDYPGERLEVIVVDGSRSPGAAESLAPFGARVRCISPGDGDPPAAIDRAIAAARGELIALQYAEDLWTPDKLRRQVALLQARPEVGLVFGDMAVVDDNGAQLCASYWEASGITPHRGRPLGALMRGNFVPAGTLVVRASLRERFLPLSGHPGCEDWWIASRVAEVAELDYVPVSVLRFRGPGRNLCLDADGGIVLRDRLHEVPLRRWLLTHLRAGATAPVDLLASCERFEHCALALAGQRGLPLSVIVPVTEHDAAMAAAAVRVGRAALRHGDLPAAARAAARACGFDPQREDVGRLLAAVRVTVARESARGAEARAAAGARAGDQRALKLRSFVTLALAEELVQVPELLRAYAQTFGEDDDASLLMVLASATPASVHALVGAVVAAGLDSRDGADLVATAVGGPVPPALVRRAAALLSPYEQPGTLGDLPRVDADSVGRLRTWMDRGEAA